MAKFIGSYLTDNNWGEDYFISKLVKYFDDTHIVYRNRMLFGTQFDVCMLVPEIGVVIFEVKAWRPDTILRVENGDSVWIKDAESEHGQSSHDPTGQVRGYVFGMRTKIRQKTGKKPLVLGMVCFPQITEDIYKSKGLDRVCEHEITILKEDLMSKAALYHKVNLAIKNCALRGMYCSKFDQDLLFRTRQIYENDLTKEDLDCVNANVIEECAPYEQTFYSYFVSLPGSYSNKQFVIDKICKYYSVGTKIYAIVDCAEDVKRIGDKIDEVLVRKGLTRDNAELHIDFEGRADHKPPVREMGSQYTAFNISVVFFSDKLRFMECFDGGFQSDDSEYIKGISQKCRFNYEQFEIEHADCMKNILVKAGAGTGKTYTMISRISYICHMQKCSLREMVNRIVMITFTNDAAENMEKKIKEYFNNYYLLTNNLDCLDFVSQIDKMQIGTIHSYAKNMIGLLGGELGYGHDLTITSGEYKRKKIVSEMVDRYLKEKQSLYGEDYIDKLGIPIYAIQNNVISFIKHLHNQSIDIPSIKAENFGEPNNKPGDSMALHALLAAVIPETESEYNRQLREENKVHLSSIMSVLRKCLSKEENLKHLKQMETGCPKFMFIDEFQDTDDTQIEALQTIAEVLEYKLFVVGDIKQCIYRFRGAKEKAFDQLHCEEHGGQWCRFSLNWNYRTDMRLLRLFDFSFADWGRHKKDGEQLLVYNPEGDLKNESDRLQGVRDYNSKKAESDFYRKITITNETMRMDALFAEVERQVERIRRRIKEEQEKNRNLPDEQRELAILVRENWQADLVHKEGKARGIQVQTNTSGDLYRTEPAIDMLKLANALIHYDESDYLYSFVASNFIINEPSKAYMYKIREDENKNSWKPKKKEEDVTQTKELLKLINTQLSGAVAFSPLSWDKVVASVRTRPILQVLRTIYSILKPWRNFGDGNSQLETYYKENVDLLFEELITSSDSESLSLNVLAEILSVNIATQKNVDSRVPVSNANDVVVRCVTVHKSKGLEYGSVILPFCSFAIDKMKRSNLNISTRHEGGKLEIGYQMNVPEKSLNVRNSFFNEKTEKEERKREEARILYVAMTRAIETFSWIVLDGKKGASWQELILDGGVGCAL